MAINLMIGALDRGPADRSEAMVLLALADGADADSGETWPRVARIAQRARMTPRAVQLVLCRLEQGGWLTRQRRTLPNGRHTSTLYTLDVSRLDPERAALREAKAARRAAKGEAGSPIGVNAVQGRGEAASPSEGEAGSPLETNQLKQGGRAKASAVPQATARRSLPEGSGARSLDVGQDVQRRQPERAARASDPRDVAALSPVQRKLIREGSSVFVGGEVLKPSSAAFAAWAEALAQHERRA